MGSPNTSFRSWTLFFHFGSILSVQFTEFVGLILLSDVCALLHRLGNKKKTRKEVSPFFIFKSPNILLSLSNSLKEKIIWL